ncbi:MAG: 16S rRNA (guanine(527)-N(7))-methyltransferase RsmG [bacterium]|nr:16S rRNA (guanine(527)-N(7))-methyltransferase RsmG [bacterium]
MDESKQRLSDILNKGLLQLGIKPGPRSEEKVLIYVNELIDWSQKINLTAIKVPEDIIVKHFLDSLVCLKEIVLDEEKAPKLLDIGTGAGFPGLPLKIFCPDLSVSLMEATGKKIRFLEELLKKLDIKDVSILHGRAEELSKKMELQEKFDIVVIRAVGELKLLVKHSFPFIKNGGCLLALKGVIIDEEVAKSQKDLKKMKGLIDKILDYELISGKKGKLIKIVKGNVNG